MSDYKHYRASIICCARWETSYIGEWIRYHIDLGFDHIYLVCNDDDPADLKREIGDLPLSYRRSVSFRPFVGQGQQFLMYLDALTRAQYESEWISFLDIDEFLVLKKWNSISALLDAAEQDGTIGIYFNWLFFGNNGYADRPQGSVLANYTRRAERIDPHTKHISRASCFEIPRIRNATFPIWHGLTDPHWKGFSRSNVLGDDVAELLQHFPANMNAYIETGTHSDRIIETAYVAHFAFKSQNDFAYRIARGLSGNFGGQIKWQRAIEAGETAKILAEMNAVEDTYLRDRVDTHLHG